MNKGYYKSIKLQTRDPLWLYEIEPKKRIKEVKSDDIKKANSCVNFSTPLTVTKSEKVTKSASFRNMEYIKKTDRSLIGSDIPIETIITNILIKLKISADVSDSIALLKHNFIYNERILLGLDPKYLDEMALPLAIKNELDKMIKNKKEPNIISGIADESKSNIKQVISAFMSVESNINNFTPDFFRAYFELDKNAKKRHEFLLPENKIFIVRSLFNLIIKFIDNPFNINSFIKKASLMYTIFGLNNLNKNHNSYFAYAFSETLDNFINQMITKKDIFRIIKKINKKINNEYAELKRYTSFKIFLKFKTSKWRSRICEINCNKIKFYKINKNSGIKMICIKEINLLNITNLQKNTGDNQIKGKTDHCFSFDSDRSYNICANSQKDMNILFNKISKILNPK